MVASARAKYVRMSPRKLRYVVDTLRNKSILEAEQILLGINKRGKYPVYKVIKSAVSNALQKNIPLEALYISKITVDPGPIWKRYRAGTMGRAMPIRKRTSHITVELDVRYPEMPLPSQGVTGEDIENIEQQAQQEQGEKE